MNTETKIKEFQKKNQDSDIMGVVRMFYPDMQMSIQNGKKKKK